MCVTYGCTRCDAYGYTQLGPRGRGPAKGGRAVAAQRPARARTLSQRARETKATHTPPKRLRMCCAGILCCSDGSSLTVTSLSLFPIRCHSPPSSVPWFKTASEGPEDDSVVPSRFRPPTLVEVLQLTHDSSRMSLSIYETRSRFEPTPVTCHGERPMTPCRRMLLFAYAASSLFA